MNKDDRLNLRARQILDDQTLPQKDRIANPEALLQQLAKNAHETPDGLDRILSQISDETIREQMRQAIALVVIP